ncbi:carbohydrate ABC transporter permease [Ketogulonicigenium vulgare]|uniref:carbohydrate ABC transporter permease n=1 Tax=Ketogulonicigenium vulgare TaxID=92945 RepID=UPI002359AC6E|nr:sugar ABC transporter permease [Ketogulonicigenium vulgare]
MTAATAIPTRKPPAHRLAAPYLLIAPSFLLAAFIVFYPLYALINTSMRSVNRFGMIQGLNDFANYTAVFADPQFQAAAWRSLVWTGAIIVGTIIISMGVALLLNRKFHGRALARVIVILPWSVSLSLLTVVWRWALNAESGLLNHLLMQLHIIDAPVVWLGNGQIAFTVQIVIGILVSIPFTSSLLLGGLSSLPSDIYEAAEMEGATPWQQFCTITLPLMRPFLNIAVVLNMINVFNSFPIIWILTEGGPANSTDILVTYLYKIAFKYGKLGEASVVSLLMIVFLLICSVIYLRLISKEQSNA